ncbi:MAG: hypothetical protein J2P57_25460 [Acidimicrobiaceae bacterium]|nr:hypothetical protein [Acidimicrobiaceae bacterium]
MASADEVRLAVPARPEYLRLARVTAAGLASRLGFSYDEVEDLRLAIDELCFGLTGSQGRDGTVSVHYLLDGDRLVVEGAGHFSSPEVVHHSELSNVILTALVDEHLLDNTPDGPRFWMVKRRQRSSNRGEP